MIEIVTTLCPKCDKSIPLEESYSLWDKKKEVFSKYCSECFDTLLPDIVKSSKESNLSFKK